MREQTNELATLRYAFLQFLGLVWAFSSDVYNLSLTLQPICLKGTERSHLMTFLLSPYIISRTWDIGKFAASVLI